jgi:hypothetical protein
MLITGHLAEWMLYLPKELRAPDAVLERAATWLRKHLDEMSSEQKLKEFCPTTHAAFVLRAGHMRVKQ